MNISLWPPALIHHLIHLSPYTFSCDPSLVLYLFLCIFLKSFYLFLWILLSSDNQPMSVPSFPTVVSSRIIIANRSSIHNSCWCDPTSKCSFHENHRTIICIERGFIDKMVDLYLNEILRSFYLILKKLHEILWNFKRDTRKTSRLDTHQCGGRSPPRLPSASYLAPILPKVRRRLVCNIL